MLYREIFKNPDTNKWVERQWNDKVEFLTTGNIDDLIHFSNLIDILVNSDESELDFNALGNFYEETKEFIFAKIDEYIGKKYELKYSYWIGNLIENYCKLIFRFDNSSIIKDKYVEILKQIHSGVISFWDPKTGKKFEIFSEEQIRNIEERNKRKIEYMKNNDLMIIMTTGIFEDINPIIDPPGLYQMLVSNVGKRRYDKKEFLKKSVYINEFTSEEKINKILNKIMDENIGDRERRRLDFILNDFKNKNVSFSENQVKKFYDDFKMHYVAISHAEFENSEMIELVLNKIKFNRVNYLKILGDNLTFKMMAEVIDDDMNSENIFLTSLINHVEDELFVLAGKLNIAKYNDREEEKSIGKIIEEISEMGCILPEYTTISYYLMVDKYGRNLKNAKSHRTVFLTNGTLPQDYT